MPKQSKSQKASLQGKSINSLKAALYKAQQTAITTQNRKQYARAKKKIAQLKLEITLKGVQGTGIYNPKSSELTPYRKRRLKKIADEFGDFFDPAKFQFIKAPKNARDKLKSMDMKVTPLGVFVPKENYKKVSLKRDKKRGEYYIEKSGKTKFGPNAGKKYRSILPISSIDELEIEIANLEAMAGKLLPLKDNERLSFIIKEGGHEGYSKATFTDMRLLLNYVSEYRKTIAARVQLYRHLEIVKTSSSKQWFSDHPSQGVKPFFRNFKTPRNLGHKGKRSG